MTTPTIKDLHDVIAYKDEELREKSKALYARGAECDRISSERHTAQQKYENLLEHNAMLRGYIQHVNQAENAKVLVNSVNAPFGMPSSLDGRAAHDEDRYGDNDT